MKPSRIRKQAQPEGNRPLAQSTPAVEATQLSSSDLGIDQATHRSMFRFIVLTRELEDRIERKLYRQGKIVGGVYVGRGQEAIGVASCIQTRPEDVVCPSHRDMGAFLIRGMSARKILAQYMGRRDGYTRGRDGNMHMGDMGKAVIPFVSMLGDSIPIAAGIGLTFKMRREPRVVLCYFGDGATSRGDWHEGMNLACVHKVPAVFICNNNQYAYSTPLDFQMAVENVADRAAAYAIPAVIVDGNDVLQVYRATRDALARARAGLGPSLIECKTFRMTGHSAHDDAGYVPNELFEEWEKKDPIARYRKCLIDLGVLTPDEIQQLQGEAVKEVDDAVEWAEQSPYPDPEECMGGVYWTE